MLFGFYNFKVIPDGYIFKTLDEQGNEHLGNKKYNTLLVTDKNFKLKYASLPVTPGRMNYGGHNYLYKSNDDFYITQRFEDTIYHYSIKTNKLEAAYIIDYHSKKLPDEYAQNAKGNDFFRIISENDYYYYLGEYLDTKYQQVFVLCNDYLKLYTIIYRDKRSGKMFGGSDIIMDEKELPLIAFPKSTFGDYFISICYPSSDDALLKNSSIISDKDKQAILNLKADDNPYLVFFQLKEF